MRIINGKIYFKVLFFGTALAGKTTSLRWLFNNVIPDDMKITPEIKSIETSFGQTLLFDFTLIQLNRNIHVRIFTATGQNYYMSTRKMLFADVDGIFFVVDSQKKELEHNREFVVEFNRYLDGAPRLKNADVIVLFNKNDMKDIHAAQDLAQVLKLKKYPSFSVSSLMGTNLREAFIAMIRRMLERLEQEARP